MSALLRQQMLMMAQASQLDKVRYVGPCVDVANASSPIHLALPAAAQAGDFLVAAICLQSSTAATVSGPAGSTDWFAGLNNLQGTQYAYLYTYALAASDITNGYVAFTFTASASPQVLVSGCLFRNVDALDAGPYSNVTSPSSFPAPAGGGGLTTTKDGDMLVYAGFGSVPSASAVSFTTTPTGFSQASNVDYGTNALTVAFAPQQTAAAVPPVSAQLAAVGATGSGVARGAQFAIKTPPMPSVVLTSDLPAGVVGYPYSGTVTATNQSGASGTLTITSTALPAGLAMSNTTGASPLTTTVSGTPT